MNYEGGYTKQCRRLWGHPAFRSKQEAAVFSWMISAAQWRDARISTKFGPVDLEAGELLVAERVLADDFGMHRNTVRALLQRMSDEGIITRFLDRCPARAGTVVRIINYKSYQCVDASEQDAKDRKRTEGETEEGPQEDRKRTKNNTFKELTLEADASKATVIAFPLGQDPSPTKPQSQDLNALFSEWWQFVPRKVSKGQAEKAYRAAVKHTDPAELLAGIKRFATDCEGRDPQFVAHPATWLNGKRWLDEPGLPLNGGSNAQRYSSARETPEQATHRRREALADALARRMAAGGGGAGAH
ncbi:hypothetical protein ACJ41P_10460 [Azospirillum argentinense]|uniref:Helix-turn-helix domain-containing protein n=1 Tax=Azospirillum argentinense TaxID=2970906 RepID=A0ABW8V4W5_9PROT